MPARAAADVETAVAVAAVAHKVRVETVAVTAVAMAADVVVNTRRLARKARAVHKAMVAVVVRAVAVLLWVMRNRAAMKADLAAAWVSALPVPRRAVNPILCAPVSI